MSERAGARATSYSWTARNQVASVRDAGGKVSFGYDGLGRAVMQTSRSLLSSDRISSVFDGLVPVGEDSSVSGVRSLVRDVTGDVAISPAIVDDVRRQLAPATQLDWIDRFHFTSTDCRPRSSNGSRASSPLLS